MNENPNINGEFGWESEITDGENRLVEAGTYRFRVADLTRARHEAREGSKIPNCPKAILRLHILDGTAQVIGEFDENLLLTRSMEWKLAAFFRSIGLKRHGQPFRMDWSKVPGAEGRAEVEVRTYDRSDGGVGKANQVKAFLDPDPEDAEDKIPF